MRPQMPNMHRQHNLFCKEFHEKHSYNDLSFNKRNELAPKSATPKTCANLNCSRMFFAVKKLTMFTIIHSGTRNLCHKTTNEVNTPHLYYKNQPFTNCSNCASSIISNPNARALSNLLPASSPAITKLTVLDTVEDSSPPKFSIILDASPRV